MAWYVKIYKVGIGVDEFKKIMKNDSVIESVFSHSKEDSFNEFWDIEIFFNNKPNEIELDIQLRIICSINNYPVPYFEIKEIKKIDWNKINQENFPDIFIGRFLLTLDLKKRRNSYSRNIIYLKAAEAFGTGYHNSTKGCILALEFLKKKSNLDYLLSSGTKCLDLGTGTGVLAFIFCQLWPSKVLALDIDPIALEISELLAKKNYFANRISFIRTHELRANNIINHGSYALIMANILATPLKKLVNEIKKNTIKNGRVLLSGILIEQFNGISNIYRKHGFVLEKKWILGDWITILFYKP